MSKILDFIDETSFEKPAFITNDEKISFLDIKNLYKNNLEQIKALENSYVVIKAKSRLQFALLLSILDGNVKRILFLPEDINDSLAQEFYEQTKINYEVFLEDEKLKIKEISQIKNSIDFANTQWIIPTSGTTNKPKLVAHTLSSLSKTTKKDKSKDYIWGLTFDIYRFSGIQVFLQAVLTNSTLIISNNEQISKIVELFLENKCNIISATPSFWRKLLMIENSKKLKLKRATLGGEIADETIIKALKKEFKDIKITHIYASTEAGVGFAVTDEQAGFPYKYIKDGIKDVKMKIDEKSRLLIKPIKQSQNYINLASMYDNQGYINTYDLVKVENNRVYFLGRESACINVGGTKVLPEEVEALILKSNLVNAVHVYGKKNPILGSLVCANIEAKDKNADMKKLKDDVLNYCKKHLQKYKIPAIIKVVDKIQITQSGKIKRS